MLGGRDQASDRTAIPLVSKCQRCPAYHWHNFFRSGPTRGRPRILQEFLVRHMATLLNEQASNKKGPRHQGNRLNREM